MKLLLFLIQVFIISFSGAAQPGPVTAAAIAMGARSRYAGLALALGHAIIEFPLMILIILGLSRIFESAKTQIVIGLAGGMFLLIMAIQMLANSRKADRPETKHTKTKHPNLGNILKLGLPKGLAGGLWRGGPKPR